MIGSTLVMANVDISARVIIGKKSISSKFMHKTRDKDRDDVQAGMGSVVTKDIERNSVGYMVFLQNL